MYIYIYINTYVYFFSFPPFISRFLFSTVSAPIYDLNCFKPRDPCNRKSTRDVCGQDVVHYFLFHLAIANADWSFPNLMFFSSLPEKRESFPRFSPPPSFRIDPITPKIRQFFLSFPSHLFFLFPNPWTWKKKRKSLPNRFLPSFFLNFSWHKFPYFQFKLVFFWSHRFNSDRFLI